MIVLHDSRIW